MMANLIVNCWGGLVKSGPPSLLSEQLIKLTQLAQKRAKVLLFYTALEKKTAVDPVFQLLHDKFSRLHEMLKVNFSVVSSSHRAVPAPQYEINKMLQ